MRHVFSKAAHVLLAAPLALSCGGKGNGGPDDAATDPDPVDDVAHEDVAAEEPGDVVEEEVPVDCSGTGTRTFEFLLNNADLDPLPGVQVVIKCLDELYEGTSGADGRVTFENLNHDIFTDVTIMYDPYLFTILGTGGSRTDPETVTYRFPVPGSTLPTLDGDVVHSVSDSWVIVATDTGWYNITQGSRYSLASRNDTGCTMLAMEFTSDGTVATPVGYSVITYDYPSSGTEGPAADPTGSTLSTATLTVDFDISTSSPIPRATLPSESGGSSDRLRVGLRGFVMSNAGNWMPYGFTTSWTGDFDTATVTVAYAGSGVSTSGESFWEFKLADSHVDWAANPQIRDDPSTWTTFTMHDVPEIPGLVPTGTVSIDTDIEIVRPGWTDHVVMNTFIRTVDTDGVYSLTLGEQVWGVYALPEVTGFNFTDLPLPSGMTTEDVLPSEELMLGASAGIYADDPFVDYRVWLDLEWGGDNSLGAYINSQFTLTSP